MDEKMTGLQALMWAVSISAGIGAIMFIVFTVIRKGREVEKRNVGNTEIPK